MKRRGKASFMKGLIVVSFLVVRLALAEDLQHGIGMIYPSMPLPEQIGTYFPANGLKVYSRPNGYQIGYLLSVKDSDGSNRVSFRAMASKPYFQLEYTSITQVSYSNTVVVFFEESQGFLRIISKEKDYWVQENEVSTSNFLKLGWSQFLIEKSDHLIGYFPKNPGLNLRDSPSKEGKLFRTLIGDAYQISLTKIVKGLWVKVKVIKLKDQPSPCGDGSFDEKMEGWIKLLDDNLTPNVIFYFDC
jgi:hypothetical protein